MSFTIEKSMSVIEAMNAGNGQNFEGMSGIYFILFSAWGEALTAKVVQHAALHSKWRPSPAELREVAAKLESPIPLVDEALAEVLDLIDRVGIHGVTDPKNPRVRMPGSPTFSHPIIARVVKYCGGWESVCDGNAQMQKGGLQGNFRAAYRETEADWNGKVANCLQTGTRPADLFPVYVPYAHVQQQAQERRQIESTVKSGSVTQIPAAPRKPDVPMPAHFREKLAFLTKKVGIEATK